MLRCVIVTLIASCAYSNRNAQNDPTAPLYLPTPTPEEALSESLHGSVHLGDGIFPTPAAFVDVELVRDGQSAFRTTTDAAGRFEFGSGVPLGAYELRVTGTHVGTARIVWRGSAREGFEVVARPR